MIVSYFNNTKPTNIVFLSVILIILMLSRIFFNDNLVFSVQNLVNGLLFLFSFVIFNSITKGKLVSSKKDFGILFYVLLSGLFFTVFFDFNKITANLLLLFSLKQLYNLSNKESNERELLFNNGFLIGLASLFFPFSIFYLLLSTIAILAFNKLSFKTLLIPFIGFFLPFFFVFILKDLAGVTLVDSYYPEFTFSSLYIFNSTTLQLTGGFMVLLIIGALFKTTVNLNSELDFYKKYHFLIIVQLLIGVLIFIFSIKKDGSEMIFIIFPISVLLGNFISLIQKKRIANAIIFSLILLIFAHYNF